MGKKFVNVLINGQKIKISPQDIRKIHRKKIKILPFIPFFNKTI